MINAEQITARLRMMSDSDLQRFAEMNKKDPYLFPLAFNESNMRKKVRMAGAAQQAAPQPPVNEQAVAAMTPAQLPENQGIGVLNPNLQFADGGLVAFAAGGAPEDEYEANDDAYSGEMPTYAYGGAVRFQNRGSVPDMGDMYGPPLSAFYPPDSENMPVSSLDAMVRAGLLPPPASRTPLLDYIENAPPSVRKKGDRSLESILSAPSRIPEDRQSTPITSDIYGRLPGASRLAEKKASREQAQAQKVAQAESAAQADRVEQARKAQQSAAESAQARADAARFAELNRQAEEKKGPDWRWSGYLKPSAFASTAEWQEYQADPAAYSSRKRAERAALAKPPAAIEPAASASGAPGYFPVNTMDTATSAGFVSSASPKAAPDAGVGPGAAPTSRIPALATPRVAVPARAAAPTNLVGDIKKLYGGAADEEQRIAEQRIADYQKGRPAPETFEERRKLLEESGGDVEKQQRMDEGLAWLTFASKVMTPGMNPIQALVEGAAAGTSQYAAAQKDLKKAERERKMGIAALAEAQRAANRQDYDAVETYKQKAFERADNLRGAETSAIASAMNISFQEASQIRRDEINRAAAAANVNAQIAAQERMANVGLTRDTARAKAQEVQKLKDKALDIWTDQAKRAMLPKNIKTMDDLLVYLQGLSGGATSDASLKDFTIENPPS